MSELTEKYKALHAQYHALRQELDDMPKLWAAYWTGYHGYEKGFSFISASKADVVAKIKEAFPTFEVTSGGQFFPRGNDYGDYVAGNICVVTPLQNEWDEISAIFERDKQAQS